MQTQNYDRGYLKFVFLCPGSDGWPNVHSADSLRVALQAQSLFPEEEQPSAVSEAVRTTGACSDGAAQVAQLVSQLLHLDASVAAASQSSALTRSRTHLVPHISHLPSPGHFSGEPCDC